MFKPSTLLLNPLGLAASGIIILGVIAVIMTSSIVSKNGETEAAATKRIARSSGHPADATPSTSEGPRKSKGRSEEKIARNGKPLRTPEVAEKSKRKELMIRISVQARNELKGLREKYKTEFDSPESRKAFSDRLRAVTDAEERKRLLAEHDQARRIARDKMEAEKGFPGRAREKRLIALMQVQNLWRMNSFVAQNETLKAEAEQFDNSLAEWVATAEEMSEQEFHESFNALRNTLNDLRTRNGR